MKPPISLLISTGLVSLLMQPSAIAQMLACRRCPPLEYGRYGNCLRDFGINEKGNRMWLYTCTLRPAGGGMAFTYRLNRRRPVEGWTSCRDKDNSWYVGSEYVPANSPAAQDMVRYICNARHITSFQ